MQANNHLARVTVSIGLVAFNGGDETQEDLLKRADLLLYSAKNAGRNLLMAESPVDPEESIAG